MTPFPHLGRSHDSWAIINVNGPPRSDDGFLELQPTERQLSQEGYQWSHIKRKLLYRPGKTTLLNSLEECLYVGGARLMRLEGTLAYTKIRMEGGLTLYQERLNADGFWSCLVQEHEPDSKARLASSLTSCRAYKGNQTELAENSSVTRYYSIFSV